MIEQDQHLLLKSLNPETFIKTFWNKLRIKKLVSQVLLKKDHLKKEFQRVQSYRRRDFYMIYKEKMKQLKEKVGFLNKNHLKYSIVFLNNLLLDQLCIKEIVLLQLIINSCKMMIEKEVSLKETFNSHHLSLLKHLSVIFLMVVMGLTRDHRNTKINCLKQMKQILK